jgi:hypothetical protein
MGFRKRSVHVIFNQQQEVSAAKLFQIPIQQQALFRYARS